MYLRAAHRHRHHIARTPICRVANAVGEKLQQVVRTQDAADAAAAAVAAGSADAGSNSRDAAAAAAAGGGDGADGHEMVISRGRAAR